MTCAWSADSADTWVLWESPRLHQVNAGDADLFFTVPPAPAGQSRRATVTLGNWPLTIVQ